MKLGIIDQAGGVAEAPTPTQTQRPGARPLSAAARLDLKKILVPVDFSECSRKALAYALAFAKQFGAQITLLNVVPSNPPVPEMGPVDVVSIEDARQELEALKAEVRAVTTSDAVLRILRTGEPYLEIIAVAKELDMDLIILSTHGRTGLARVVLGSTAEKVVRHAGCPVLVVRENEHEFVAAVADTGGA